ncbi:hypothetical protein ABIB15_001331 [Marisediminicola sp. UYEF4]|uniref:hypothetical protein n=1 Tax=Marisediminicola sp. UYEF4 TaxID=1756384 RepID=UPI00339215D1
MTKPQFVTPHTKLADGWRVGWTPVNDGLGQGTVALVEIFLGVLEWDPGRSLTAHDVIDIPEKELAKARSATTGMTAVGVRYTFESKLSSSATTFVGVPVTPPKNQAPDITSLTWTVSASALTFKFSGGTQYKHRSSVKLRGWAVADFGEQDNKSGQYDIKNPLAEHDYHLEVRAVQSGKRDGNAAVVDVRIPEGLGSFPVVPAILRPSGKPEPGPIGAVSWGEGRIDAFGRDHGLIAHIWHQTPNHPLQGWEQITGDKIGSIQFVAVSTRKPGVLDVFACDDRDALLHAWYENGRWGGWERVTVGVNGSMAVAAASVTPDRIDVLIATQTGVDHHYWSGNDAKWHHDDSVAGYDSWVTKRLALCPINADALAAVAVNRDGKLQTTRFRTEDDGNVTGTNILMPSGLERLDANSGPNPSIFFTQRIGLKVGQKLTNRDELEIFVTGTDGLVHHVKVTDHSEEWRLAFVAEDPIGFSIASWDPPEDRTRYDAFVVSRSGATRHHWSDDGMQTVQGPEDL